MRTIPLYIIALSILSLTSFAYADSIQVDMAQGTASNQDCDNQCFIPSTVNIKVGDTITWQNKDSAAHTATANDGSFDTSLVNAGASSSRTFNTAGSYPYICILHPWMKGTVIVGNDIYEKARLARENYTPEFIIKTELPLYDQGDTVKVSGFITNLDANNAIDVTLRVIGPITNGNSGNIVSIDNIKPNIDGSFESTFNVAGDRWIKRGDYKILANYGPQKVETVFFYNGGMGELPPDVVPPPQCAPGQIIVNGQCISENTYQDPIIVFTDEDHYGSGDVITIFGEVGEKLIGYDVTFQLTNSNGDLVTAQQLPVSDENTFELELNTGGPLWRSTGTYTVKVLYGTASRSAETTFEFSGTSQQLPIDASVSIPAGAATPGCEETNECYIESEVEIAVGGEVVWSNDDSASHTVTSGDPKNGPDGNFDSNLFLAGQTFTHRFDEQGEFPYFCLVHPWMTGTVFVGQDAPNPNPVPLPLPDTNLPSEATVIMARGTASNQNCGDQCYMPNVVAVAAGGKVTWNNVDSAAHTTTEMNNKFDSSLVMAGGKFSHTFDEAGIFDYMCIIHPWMRGTVIVGQGVPNPDPTPIPDIELVVNVDKAEYDLGELTTLNVYISDVSSPQNVAITVTDPFGAIMISRTLTTDFNGNANTDFKIAESFKTGTYRIDATSSVNGETYSDISEFRVTSQFNQIQIVSAQGTDQQGNPIQFSRGAMGFVKVQVNAQKPIATLITVNVFDSDLTPLGVGSLKTTLNTGQSELILSFMIPQDAVVGTADIYVNALSDWVSAGGIPQTGEFAGQVKIN